jgi:hypothetical protein
MVSGKERKVSQRDTEEEEEAAAAAQESQRE